MTWLVGQWPALGGVAGKAFLIYLTALLMLRVAPRRTVAEWTLIDFVTAVAVGAVVGRTAVAGTQSYVSGATALLVLLLAQQVASRLRFWRPAQRATEHPVRVLVERGRLLGDQLDACALTEDDLAAHLRQRGIWSLDDIAYVLYEAEGALTVVPAAAVADGVPDLVRRGLQSAVARR